MGPLIMLFRVCITQFQVTIVSGLQYLKKNLHNVYTTGEFEDCVWESIFKKIALLWKEEQGTCMLINENLIDSLMEQKFLYQFGMEGEHLRVATDYQTQSAKLVSFQHVKSLYKQTWLLNASDLFIYHMFIDTFVNSQARPPIQQQKTAIKIT